MESLREFICYNQKQIIKFEYVVSNLHKDFREAYNDKNISSDKIKELYEKLHIDSFILMEKIFKENFKFIKNTFGSNDEDLRFTVKIVNGDYVTDIFRSHTINNLFYESRYEENTVFDEIMNNGKKYFYSDNLEELYKRGEYKNPRLKDKELLLKGNIKWKEFWNNYNDTKEINNYYNSTFVMPMSMTSDNEDKQSGFYNRFFEQKSESIVQSQTRTIWGFVCLDSKKTDYFKSLTLKNIDFIDLGYIVSDILSIYLVYFYNYTLTSETIINYEKSIN